VVLVVVLAAFTGYQAVKVHSNLEKVASESSTLSRQLTSGDQAGARRTLRSAQQHASAARHASSGPGWWLGRRLPKVGDDVGAVRTVADVADNLARNVLPDVVAAGATLGPEHLRPVHGRIGRQADASLIGSFATPALPLTKQELALFGPGLGTYAQDVNFTPDFPRSAQLIRAMWKARTGVSVDGVLSADPVALSYLLRGTAPVPVAGGRTLTAGDAVQTLLSSVYADIPDPQRQNLFFESVAHSVFDAVASGRGRPATVFSNLVTAVDQRRVLLWSAHRQEQALLDPTALAGALATHPVKAPVVGVYLNDGGASKLDYYLDYSVDVASRACQSDRQVIDVTLHLRSRVPKGAAGLPDYVANNAPGLPRGVIRLSLFTYAPVGGGFGRSTLGGRTNNLSPRPHDGRTVVAQTVDLAPGTSQTLTWQMISGKGQTGRTQLRVTPGAHTDGVGHVGAPAC
jgi:hypothetical protein